MTQTDLRDRVLNRELYLNLKAAYGPVDVQNLGMACPPPKWRQDPLTGHWKLEFDSRFGKGEFYRIACPYCPPNKRRKVVYVHHLYGTIVDDRPAFGLATCYRCAFEKDAYFRNEFRQAVLRGLDMHKTRVAQGSYTPMRLGPVSWPGTMCKVSALTEEHPARRFLRGRRFEIEKLEQNYDIQFCVTANDPRYTMAVGRIVIPVKRDGELIGWQARYPGPVPAGTSIPAYYTLDNFPTDKAIYNFDSMRRCKTGIVVEGVTDVWALGGWSGALFGSRVHDPQVELLAKAFRDRSLVFLLDPDVKKDISKFLALQAAHRKLSARVTGGVALVWLPDDKDPGEYAGHRDWLLRYVRSEAAKQEVEVRYGLA